MNLFLLLFLLTERLPDEIYAVIVFVYPVLIGIIEKMIDSNDNEPFFILASTFFFQVRRYGIQIHLCEN